MDLEDLEPKKQPIKLKDLTTWNIEDLEIYINNMELEIKRAQSTINSKKKISESAASLFKSK